MSTLSRLEDLIPAPAPPREKIVSIFILLRTPSLNHGEILAPRDHQSSHARSAAGALVHASGRPRTHDHLTPPEGFPVPILDAQKQGPICQKTEKHWVKNVRIFTSPRPGILIPCQWQLPDADNTRKTERIKTALSLSSPPILWLPAGRV